MNHQDEAASPHSPGDAPRAAALLRAVSAATRQLAQASSVPAAVARALATMGSALQAECLLLFKGPPSPERAGGAAAQATPQFFWVRSRDGAPPDPGVLTRPAAGCERLGWAERVQAGTTVRAAPDEAAGPGEADGDDGEHAGALLLVPALHGGRCAHVLRAEASTERTAWSDGEAEALQTFASALAAALQDTAPRRSDDAEASSAVASASGDGAYAGPPHADSSGPAQSRPLYRMPEAVLAVNEAGQVTMLNEAAESLFEVQADAAVGAAVEPLLARIIPPQDRVAVQSMLEAQEGQSVETTMRSSDGTLCHMSIAVAPLGAGLDQAGTMAVIRDVTAARQQKARLEHRARMDRALLDVSQLLVATNDFQADELLRIVGEAMQADYAYLVVVPPESHAGWQQEDVTERADLAPIPPRAFIDIMGEWSGRLDTYTLYEWHGPSAPDAAAPQEEGGDHLSPFAVPMLSSKDLLYGYLGIEYDQEAPEWIDENARTLNVLGDLVSAYLERKVAVSALRESEERYRQFVETISEGIWCIEMEAPMQVSLSPDKQLAALRERALVTEFNATMARAYGVEEPSQVIGCRAVELVPEAFENGFFQDFIENDHRLRNKEYSFQREGEETRHFVANAIGTVEDGQLMRIWGSWTDVTDRVALEQRMVTALEQQQQRMGRELHDGVGQWLTSVRMLSQNLAERYFADGEPGHEQIQRVISYTQRASEMARELQRGLSSVQVQEGGLPEALEDLVLGIDQLPDVAASFERAGFCDVQNTETKLQLYRIAQEAINNALKHAAPSHIRLRLARDDGALQLVIADDGSGFAPGGGSDTSLGLHSMRYRARSIDADLVIDSQKGQGTTVRCTLPVEGDV